MRRAGVDSNDQFIAEWLTEVVRDRGERLGAGQIILTGSIPSLIPIAEDCGIQVDASPFGSVEVKFTP